MASETILIVDDEQGIRESLADILSDEGYEVVTAASGEEGVAKYSEVLPALMFLDVWLPGMDGLEALSQIRANHPDATVIMISGHGNIETAVKATRAGAYDFIEKPLSLERIVLAAKRAIEARCLQMKNRELRETLGQKWNLVGETGRIRQIRGQIELAARSNSRVLVTGESGTGKEIVAHLLHELSDRAGEAFVEVNCAAIPQELIESELFGHEKGSFTGAFEKKRGKFELAHGGTLFLDEIGDMSFQTQAKLLRVLESHQIQRVGGSKSINVDTRVIAATNKDIETMIREGRFRDDLYFRLNVIPILLPPLRERREDVPLLVEHFLGMLAAEYRQPAKQISREALASLMAHAWPGNIRELKNLIERLVIMTPSEMISDVGMAAPTASAAADTGAYFDIPTLKSARDHFEKDYIRKRLEDNAWNVSRTAESMEIERSNLHRKIKAYSIAMPGSIKE